MNLALVCVVLGRRGGGFGGLRFEVDGQALEISTSLKHPKRSFGLPCPEPLSVDELHQGCSNCTAIPTGLCISVAPVSVDSSNSGLK